MSATNYVLDSFLQHADSEIKAESKQQGTNEKLRSSLKQVLIKLWLIAFQRTSSNGVYKRASEGRFNTAQNANERIKGADLKFKVKYCVINFLLS